MHRAGTERHADALVRRVTRGLRDDRQPAQRIRHLRGRLEPLRRIPGDPRYAITTIYNNNTRKFGATIYEA